MFKTLKTNQVGALLLGIPVAIVTATPAFAEELGQGLSPELVPELAPELAQDNFVEEFADNSDRSTTDLLQQIKGYEQESSTPQTLNLSQVRSVSQLSDVRPTDWAYQALRSLVERYGCIAGYPDASFRGNRAMTRYEFAAGVNACLDIVNELIASATADLATQEDLLVLQRLQEEFQAELATLRGRVDGLEARTAELEANQFSTTTKLAGQAIFGFSDLITGDDINGNAVEGNSIFTNRLRLELETSFTGSDRLFTRLSTANSSNLLGDNTPEGALAFEQVSNSGEIGLEVLYYAFPIGDRTEILFGPTGIATDDFTDTINVLDGDGAEASISAFGTRSSIYYPPAGAGVGLRHQFNDLFAVSAGYLAATADDETRGFFNGDYGAIAQLFVTPTDNFNLGLTYVHGYNVEMGTGSNRANPKTFIEEVNPATAGESAPISSDAVGLAATWQVSDRFVLGGWGAYTNVDVLGGTFDGDSLDIWTGALTLSILDLIKEGNIAGLIVGVEPKVTHASDTQLEDSDTSIHVEAFFQHRINDYISITPGLIWLTAPDHNAANEDALIGTVRTTFSF